MKEEIQVYILQILTVLKQRLTDGNHAFMIGEDGRLWLWCTVKNTNGETKQQSIIFDENYENIEPEKLANNICEDLKNAGYAVQPI